MPAELGARGCRATARRPCWASSCRLLTPGGGAEPAEVRDVSGAGVGLVCRAPLAPGAVLVVQLSGPETRVAFALQARVVHARARPDGRRLVGCAFARRLPPGLAAWLR